jgi:hypothetical protein
MRVPRGLFIALVALNVLLIGIFVVDKLDFQRRAQAQEVQTAFGEYVMYSSIMESELGNMWVIDTRTRRMACYRYDRNSDSMIHFETRDLRQDMSVVGRPPTYPRSNYRR